MFLVERERFGILEEAAVEVGDFLQDDGGEGGSGGHLFPELGDEDGEALRGGDSFDQKFFKGLLGEEADVFGEEGEEEALQEGGDEGGVVAVFF